MDNPSQPWWTQEEYRRYRLGDPASDASGKLYYTGYEFWKHMPKAVFSKFDAPELAYMNRQAMSLLPASSRHPLAKMWVYHQAVTRRDNNRAALKAWKDARQQATTPAATFRRLGESQPSWWTEPGPAGLPSWALPLGGLVLLYLAKRRLS